MYIGTRKFDCVMHLFKEVLQNSIDESINEKSCCDQIIVTVDCDKKIIKVADNGRGIPLGVLEKVCTVIQSSGKFNKDSKESAYGKGTSGLNGVGITAVNALSNYFKIKSYRDGKYKLCKFEFGHLVKTEEKEIDHESGTIVEFNPNEELIGHCSYDGNEFLNLCKLMSYLLTDLRIKCEVTSGGKTVKEKFHSKNGIMDLLNELVDEPIVKPVYLCAEDSDYFVEAAFTYATEDSCKLLKENNNTFIMSFANFCTTVDGGNHVTGLKQGLSNALMKYVKENIFTKKDSKLTLTGDDTRSGLVCVLNVRLVNAEFSGQIKAKLINEDITPFVNTSIRHELNKWIKKNESQAKKIGDWIRLSCRTRIKSSEEKKNVIKQSGAFNAFSKNKIKGLSLATGKPGNLELLIVEGKSASGGAIEARDIRTTEILELKGIPFNACDTTTSRALQNVELRSLVTAMGTGIGKEFDISKCRYKKIIIMSDADRLMSA